MNTRKLASLNSLAVYNIAKAVAEKYHLRKPDYTVFRSEMFGKFPLPVILDNSSGRLWVDRFYVAYQLDGSAEVRYVYAAKHHIFEERSAYRAAAKRHEGKCVMPKEIDRQFRIIHRKMIASGSQVWVNRDEISQYVYTKLAI